MVVPLPMNIHGWAEENIGTTSGAFLAQDLTNLEEDLLECEIGSGYRSSFNCLPRPVEMTLMKNDVGTRILKPFLDHLRSMMVHDVQ